MSLARLVLRSIQYHRRLHLGLAVGTVIACAALTGSLVVGDSVRQTLYAIATARLGNIASALDWGNRYFDVSLADAISDRDGLVHTQEDPQTPFEPAEATGSDAFGASIVPVLALRGMAEAPPERDDVSNRVNRAWVYGVDERFWPLAAREGVPRPPGPQEAYVNESVAQALALGPGDDLVLRLPRPSEVPAEAPLASESDGGVSVARVRVVGVLTDEQGGRFSLATDQAMPANVYVDLRWLGELAAMEGKANLMLAGEEASAGRLQRALAGAWSPEQVGLRFSRHASGIVQLESDRLFLEEAVVRAAGEAESAQPILTYLVNSIFYGDRGTPYSFVTAGAAPPDTPLGAVCINQWLADALDAREGDRVRIAWYEPLPSGEYVERRAEAPVHRVLSMEEVAIERDLAPEFPGLSDVDSCRNWDIGLPLDEEQLLDEANEAYWKAYGQTPKLLTTFETGQDWWGNYFGSVMAVRFPANDRDAEAFARALTLSLDPAALGLVLHPVREDALEAVARAMDFGGLFIGMSLFLIAAALALLALLYAHGLQMRSGELGTLLAAGWPPARVRAWLFLETLPTLCVGVLCGAFCGAAYARLLLYGLGRFWPDAVAGTPLRYYASPAAMAQGALLSAGCVAAVLGLCVWRAGRRPARELLSRDFSATPALGGRQNRTFTALFIIALPAAALSLFQALYGAGESPTAWFFASGASALAALLAAYGVALGALVRRPAPLHPSLWRLVLGNLARRRSRSLGVAVVTACGVFIVISVTAMQAAMNYEPSLRQSGAGGFSVFATTTVPVRPEGGEVLGVAADKVAPLRLWDGDDAGCLNLNRALQPRIYGVNPDILSEREAFARPGDAEALWALLRLPLEEGVFPALVGDADTAMWGLQAAMDPERGTELAYTNDRGEPFHLRTVGSLPMRLSLFQGGLLISEENFVRLFPHKGGYRAFLVESAEPDATAATLNRDFGRLGMEAIPSEDRLRAFHAVERAYLAMFLVLGGLGMMLGAGGTVIIVLRNLSERRAEFALLVAVGYEPRAVRRMALMEHALLVAVGLAIGMLAAAMATAPLLLRADSAADFGALVIVLGGLLFAYFAAAFAATRLFLAHIPLSALRTE